LQRSEIVSRGVSGAIAAAYVLWALFAVGVDGAFAVLLLLLIPLALVWFGDDLVFPENWSAYMPTGRTPGYLLRAIGWAMLIVPAVATAYLKCGRHA